MADQLCGEDQCGPTLSEAKYGTADTVPTGHTPPAVTSQVATLLAKAPNALKPISAASVAATATMHAGERAPACHVLTQDATAERTREQEPRFPLRCQGESPKSDGDAAAYAHEQESPRTSSQTLLRFLDELKLAEILMEVLVVVNPQGVVAMGHACRNKTKRRITVLHQNFCDVLEELVNKFRHVREA